MFGLSSTILIGQNAEFFKALPRLTYNIDSLLALKKTTKNSDFSRLGNAMKGSGSGNGLGGMSLGVASANNIEGPYTLLNNKKPVFDEAQWGEQEDPIMWKDKTGYHVVFKDHVAKFTGERGAGVLSHSTDGVHWKLDKEFKAWSKAIDWNDGTRERMGQLERPFIMFENNKPLIFSSLPWTVKEVLIVIHFIN